MQQQDNNKRIARNTVFLTIRMCIVLLVGLYTSRVLLRTLGVEDYGIYNVVCGFVSMFAFINTSMINGIQRFYNFELGRNGEEGARKVYHCALLTQVIIAFIVVAATETFGLWYVYNKLVVPPERLTAAVYIFHFSVISLIFPIIQIPFSAAITAHEKMDYYAIISVIDVLLKLGIVLVLPLFKMDYLILYGLLIISINVFDFIMYFIYAKRHFPELHGRIQYHKELLREILTFSGWNLFGSFGGVMKEQGINLILNAFFGPVVNAARGIAYQVSGGVKSFVYNITTASRPQLTQSYAQGNVERTFNIMFSMSKMCYISVFIFALPVMLEVEKVLDIWLGDVIPEHTVTFILLVVASALVNSINSPVSFVVHATGKMKNYQTLTTFFNLLLLPVAYFFLKQGSTPEFVFVLNLLFTIFSQALCVYLLRRIVPLSIMEYLTKVILPCLLVTVVASILPILLRFMVEQSIWRLLLVFFTSVLSVLIASYFIGLNNSEREVVSEFVLNKIRKK